MGDDAIRTEGLRRSFGPSRRWTGSTWPPRPGPCSACSAPTGPARPPSSGSSPPCSSPTGARPRWPATTSSATPRPCARSSAWPASTRPSTRTSPGARTSTWSGASTTWAGRGQAPGRRDAGAVRAHRRRQPHRQDLLGRDAPPPRPRGQPGRPAPGAVPGRADHRPGPAQPLLALGRHPRAGQRRHHPAAHHPVPGGGRPAGRPHRRDRRRPGDRRGHHRQLKSRVGGDLLALRVTDRDRAAEAAAAIADLGSGAPQVVAEAGEVSLPVREGAALLAEVVRRLDAAGLEISDLALRRPPSTTCSWP